MGFVQHLFIAASHCFEFIRAWSSLLGGGGGKSGIVARCSAGDSLISGNRRLMAILSSAMVEFVCGPPSTADGGVLTLVRTYITIIQVHT